MCGIVGYIGNKEVSSVIPVGLERLEYRGYDSCGIASISNGKITIRKVAGRLPKLKNLLEKRPINGKVGIGHTRWATHGTANEVNAHPFTDCTQTIALVHNGIIENYRELKKKLIEKGHRFVSNTDTEVIVHLIEDYYKNSLFKAVKRAIRELKGSFAIAVISKREPDVILGARMGSPLIVGMGNKESVIASDTPALVGIAKKILLLNDGEICTVEGERVRVFDLKGKEVKKSPYSLELKVAQILKGKFAHYMRKEIFEQPEILRKNIDSRIKNNSILLGSDLRFYPDDLVSIPRILIQACGTSYHAGLVGRYLLEKFAQIPTEVEIASEFYTRKPLVDGKPLILGISQSGETADTLQAIREAKLKSLRVLSVLNVKRSLIDRESDGVLYINAGPEIGVASTKAYTAQILTLFLFSLYIANLKGILSKSQLSRILKEIKTIPEKVNKTLSTDRKLRRIAQWLSHLRHFLFLGRGINYPSALEGALKLKEVSYIPAMGYPAGEMKHGPISLIDKKAGVVCIAPKGSVYDKMLSNIEEVKTRGGQVISIATEGDKEIVKLSKEVVYIPESPEYLSPIFVAIPLQLLAYYIAVFRGCDVDKPRNLAKSVTVE